MIVCNLICFYIITLNYEASIKSRLLAITYMYAMLCFSEIFISSLTGYLKQGDAFSRSEYSSIVGQIETQLLVYAIVLVIGNYTNIKRGVEIPISRWIFIFSIPLGSFYIIFTILRFNNMNPAKTMSCVIALMGLNIATFYLYDSLAAYYEERLDKMLLRKQNEYYAKQFEMMNQSSESFRAMRHDLKNHLIVLDMFLKDGDAGKASEYISKIVDTCYGEKRLVESGNIEIDSILNFKLDEAYTKGIDLTYDLNIPSSIAVEPLDLVAILGNLLDNAIAACSKVTEERKISFSFRYSRNKMYIHVSNPFYGKVLYKNSKIVTSNSDKQNHGIGLSSVQSIIHKYDGTMEISHEDNVFNVDILMYIDG
ncbi:sensor histidine kinase [Anaeromicropila populeti]|nr:GHKL domain-containing protein [Anaeromicropila populeti]